MNVCWQSSFRKKNIIFALSIFMYHNVKSRIMYNNEYSDFFTCGNGVRQREILYTFLFSLCLNDLETFLEKNNVTGFK
jgi:hypothetical protein